MAISCFTAKQKQNKKNFNFFYLIYSFIKKFKATIYQILT
jgi:hypothetical protein